MNRRILQIAGMALAVMLVFTLGLMAGSQTSPASAGDDGALAAANDSQSGREEGIVIVSVDPDGPAAQAGLARGDILLAINDVSVNGQGDLIGALDALEPGDSVTLSVLHGDDRRTLTATLAERSGRPYLGVTSCVGPRLEWSSVLPVQPYRGAVIVKIVDDGPASRAGLKVGDRIVALDGSDLNDGDNLADLIAQHAPGDTVTLAIMRPGEEAREVQVTLGAHPAQDGKAYLGVEYLALPAGALDGRDVPFAPRFDGQRPFFPVPNTPGVSNGLIVAEIVPGSPADKAGLKAGDVITAIDGEAVDAPDAVHKAVAARKPGDEIKLTVRRPDQAEVLQIEVTLAESPDAPSQAYLGVRIGGFFFSHKFEGVSPDQFGAPIPHFEFSWPFDGFRFRECPCPDEPPAEPDNPADTSATL